MIKIYKFLPIALLGVFITFISFTPDLAVARAGGGGGGSGGGGFLTTILMPFLLIYAGLISYLAYRKNRQSRELIKHISNIDPAWSLDHLKDRVEETYYKVQYAWRDRDQNIAKDYMSDRLYYKHKIQTDDMLRRGVRNVMESINLKEARIVEVLDYVDNSKDIFWALIKGSMVDYTIEEKSGSIIDGKKKNESFMELWKFKREEHCWVLDEIDQEVSLGALYLFNPFSEEIA